MRRKGSDRHGENLTPNQRLAIEIWAGSLSTTETRRPGGALAQDGLHLAGIPGFHRSTPAGGGRKFAAVGAAPALLGEMACKALEAALGEDMPMSVRLRAADLVTSRGPALAELTQVIERLEALEGAQHGKA